MNEDCIGGFSPRHKAKLHGIDIDLSSYDGCKNMLHKLSLLDLKASIPL